MDWLGLAAAGINAVGNLASSSYQAALNSDLNYENKAWNLKMWDLNNTYNHPKYQRNRLEEAGINPALAMQDNANVASQQPNQVPSVPYDLSGIGSGISNAMANLLQARQIESETSLLDSQTEGQRIHNMTLYAKDVADIAQALAAAKKSGADTTWLEWQYERSQAMFDAEYKRNYHEILALDAKTDLDNTHAEYQKLLNRFAPNQQKIITENLIKQGMEIDSNVNRNNRAAALDAAREALTDAQKSGVVIDNYTKNQMAEFVVDEQFYKSQRERYSASSEKKRWKEGELGYRLPAGGSNSVPITRKR